MRSGMREPVASAVLPSWGKALAAALAMRGEPGAVALPRAAGTPLLAAFEPLPPQAAPLVNALSGASIRLIDPAATVTAPAQARWRSAFALTPAEVRLAAALIDRPANLTEIADRLGIAYATARKQMAALFHKTGTSGQTSLIKMLSALM